MSGPVTARAGRAESAPFRFRSESAGWRVVAVQESRDLWISGRGLLLVFVYSILLSVITYLAAANRTPNFLEQREAVNLTCRSPLQWGCW